MQNSIQDRRAHARIDFDASALIIKDDISYRAAIHDISLKGALVSKPLNWNLELDTNCILQLDLSEQEPITIQTNIRRIDEKFIGLECESIDLDSISRLRRLVELNLGDEALLERELEALAQHTLS